PRGRGTIEAVPCSCIITSRRSFHVREDVAPLKQLAHRSNRAVVHEPVSTSARTWHRWSWEEHVVTQVPPLPSFHVREDVAPLKRGDGAEDRRVGRRFHVREDVAPLKPRCRCSSPPIGGRVSTSARTWHH